MMLSDCTPRNFFMPYFDTFDIEAVKNTDYFLSQRQVGVVHSVGFSLVLFW